MFDDINDAGELIATAIGAASMCWENVKAAGVFDSSQAAEIADAARQRLQTILAGEFQTTLAASSCESPPIAWIVYSYDMSMIVDAIFDDELKALRFAVDERCGHRVAPIGNGDVRNQVKDFESRGK